MTEIMLAPFSGIDHPGRIFLARVGYHRHEGRGEPDLLGDLTGMMNEKENSRALVLGLALRLAFTLCGATTGLLPRTRLSVSKNFVTLTLDRKDEALTGEVVEKRLNALARSLGRKGEVKIK
jgi:exopolyphosphatase/guanosine-5'-triphosphate,3'-diphosphate pyrophosphatase